MGKAVTSIGRGSDLSKRLDHHPPPQYAEEAGARPCHSNTHQRQVNSVFSLDSQTPDR